MDNWLVCKLYNCNACTGKQELLPPTITPWLSTRICIDGCCSRLPKVNHALRLLFFSVVTEDVAHPSICSIAVFIVLVVFGMGVIASYDESPISLP
jgi:hypothetical protein